MSISSLIKLVILGAALYSGVQYAKVYIHKTQLAKAMGLRHNGCHTAHVHACRGQGL